MQEKNREVLTKLLGELPVYQPPAGVWERLDHYLSIPSQKGWNNLPEYQPPDDIWHRIESGLDTPVSRPLPVNRLKRVLPWAASVAATLAMVVWFVQPSSHAGSGDGKVSLSYSREVVDASLLQRDWEQDEEAFDMINRLCAGASFTCANPDMQSLQAELEELTMAKNSLEEALGKYGTDIDLIGQLTEIERQRTALLKQILDYFI